MDVAKVGATGGKKVSQLLLRKAKQTFILLHIICLLCVCRDNLIFHGVKERQTLEIASVEHVVCTCSG